MGQREIDEDKIMQKMRELKNKRELELDSSTENEKDNEIQTKVKNVKYLGTIQMKSDEGVVELKDIFLMVEENGEKEINKIITEEEVCLGIITENGEFIPSEEEMDDEYILEQFEQFKDEENKIDLRKMTEEKVNELSLMLGKDKNEIKNIMELNLEQDIDEQIEENNEKEEAEIFDEEDTKKIISGKQDLKLDAKINDRKTLRQKLGLSDEYKSLIIVESDTVNAIDENANKNSTRYSVLAVKKDGSSELMNDVLEEDSAYGNNSMKDQVKINADGTAEENNKSNSTFKIKGSQNEYLSIENGQYGELKAYYGQKTQDGNELVATQLETSNVYPIDREIREIQGEGRGNRQVDKIDDEMEMHQEHGEDKVEKANPDANGEPDFSNEHMHFTDKQKEQVVEWIKEKNDKIEDIFTDKEIFERFEKMIQKDANEEVDIEKIIDDTAEDLSNERVYGPRTTDG